MIEISEHLQLAIRDYLDFQERKYPAKSVLKLICDRYGLNSAERAILFRGVALPETADARNRKLTAAPPNGATLNIDFFNQSLIVVSYLAGNSLFVSCDGILRDASGFHGKKIPEHLFARAVELICETIGQLNPPGITLFADTQINHAEEMAAISEAIFSDLPFESNIRMTREADRELASLRSGVICTADSVIIDRTVLPVFDLALLVLTSRFRAEFTDLREFCSQNLYLTGPPLRD